MHCYACHAAATDLVAHCGKPDCSWVQCAVCGFVCGAVVVWVDVTVKGSNGADVTHRECGGFVPNAFYGGNGVPESGT